MNYFANEKRRKEQSLVAVVQSFFWKGRFWKESVFSVVLLWQ